MRPRRESSAVYGFIDAALERSRRPYTSTVSAEVVGSWIRRLPHHHMVPCELWDAQTPARRPHRRVRRFRCKVELDTRRGGR